MNRLRNRLILVFVAATLLPLCLTLWTTTSLLERSFGLAPLAELDAVSKSLEKTGRELYQQARESLRRDAAEGRITPRHVPPNQAQAFWESGAAEHVTARAGGKCDLEVERDGSAVVQPFERLAGQEMHTGRRELEAIVAPIQDQFLGHHRQREAGEERQDQPPGLDGAQWHWDLKI